MFSLPASILLLVFAMSFSIVSLNTRGCRDSYKRFRILETIKHSQSADIVFLQDIHSAPQDEAIWRLVWRGDIYFSHLSKEIAGLAVCFASNLNVEVLSHEVICPGRILHLTADINGEIVHLVNVYSPPNYKDKPAFLNCLKQHLGSLDVTYPIILGGDFNCTLNTQLDRTGNVEPHPPSAATLRSIVQRFKLTDVYRSIHVHENGFTWSRSDGTAARLDRVYISNYCKQTIRSVSVTECQDSDHSFVRCAFEFKQHKRNSAYWCLNTSLLQDPAYVDAIKSFWNDWTLQKHRFSKLQTWWDVGKDRIKDLSQQFSLTKTHVFKTRQKELKNDIARLESITDEPDVVTLLTEQRSTLERLERVQLRGAWIRSRFQFVNDSDTPSKYFFNLEKRRGKKKMLSFIRSESGQIIDDDNEIRKHARSFYQNLYHPEPVNLEDQSTLLDDLPKLSQESHDLLDDPLLYDEMTKAVGMMNNNKSPGIDGLPSEFYKTFWPIIGHDVFDVFTTSIQENELPLSCRRAVLTLIPKAGDTSL
jgi:exonuclease III